MFKKDDNIRFTIPLASIEDIEDDVVQTQWEKSSVRSIGLAGNEAEASELLLNSFGPALTAIG